MNATLTANDVAAPVNVSDGAFSEAGQIGTGGGSGGGQGGGPSTHARNGGSGVVILKFTKT